MPFTTRCQEVGEGTHWWPQGWLGKMVLSYVKGNLLLFKFYLANISKLHQLPQVIFDEVLQIKIKCFSVFFLNIHF